MQSYSENEASLLFQIYEPPLQYHYLKRPYTLIPAAASEMPQLHFFDAGGQALAQDAPAEAVAVSVYDISIRPGIRYQPHPAFAVDAKVRTRLVGDLQTELVTDFFEGFARGARANVHVKTMYGRSNHHKIEAIFKAFARALRVACSKDKQLGQMLPSTKGLL